MSQETTVNGITPTGHTVRTSDDIPISIDHYGKDRSIAVILAHGFYNSKQAPLFKEMSRLLAGDVDVIAMDFRGHGKSGGRFCCGAREHQDLLAVLRFVKERGYKRIGVIGFSLGAAASVVAASQTDLIDSLIAVSAPTRFRSIEFNVFRMGKKGLEENVGYTLLGEGRAGKGVRLGNPFLRKTAPIDAIGQLEIPALFVAGTQDWIVYPRHSRRLYEKKRGKKKLYMFEAGTHAEYIFRRFPERTMELFKEWFSETLN